MAQKVIIVFVIVQAVMIQMAYGQVIGRVGGCGCGCSNILPISEQILPTQYLTTGGPVLYDQPTTIIQDSTVANNLANALQLLVVSNLLSNTLPLEPCAPLVSAPIINAPLAPLAPASYLPASYPLASPCGCGGCGSCGCGGFSPYTLVY